jgi:murein DD-endopeptidase MepM/ murein hydrolase activator NlpD
MASYAPASPEYTGSVQAPPPPAAPRPVAVAPAARTPSPTAAVPLGPANVAGAPSASPGVHVVASGDTLSKISRRYGKSIPDLAKANNLAPTATLKIGDRIIIPGTRTAKAQPKDAKLTQVKPLAPPTGKPAPAAPRPQTAAEPAQSASVVSPVAEAPAPAGSAMASADAAPSFRWPVKGRVIAGFGPKTNGQQNDGINLAVPEGTPVKAAEDGVVAYAGNELKGYGNLVLVRHSNGYVTAYAHAKELMVKRGDPIKRGQVIAKSGQTGNVDAPQLHFEVRKGPSPLDPMPLLSGG